MKKLLGNPKMLEEAKLGKPGHSWIVELLIFLVIMFLGDWAASIPITVATVIWVMSGGLDLSMNPGSFIFDVQKILESVPEWFRIVSLFATAAMTAVVIVYCTKIEKRSAASMGFRKSGNLKEYLIGAIIGILMITASLAIAMLTGSMTVAPHGLAKPAVVMLILWLAGYVLQGMSEETMVRGYLMVSMSRKAPLWICIVLSSLVFAMLHLSNPGINALAFFNLFLSGVVFAVYTVKRGNLWGACAMHTFWNFYQGCIYGVSVSGTGTVDSALFSSVSTENMQLWNGGAFGLEGGLAVTIVEVITLLVFLFLVPKAKKEQAAVTGPIETEFREVPTEPAPETTAAEPISEPETPETKKEPAADADSSSVY